MSKTVLTFLGAAVIAASAIHGAAAAEHHRVHRTARVQPQVSEPVRNANAYVPAPAPDYRSYDGALSAPAGR